MTLVLARNTCYIDTTAQVSHLMELGSNLFIGPYANLYGGKIGDGTSVGAYTEIGGAEIGARCKIQAYVFLPKGVTIEDEVFIGPRAVFTNDKYPRASKHWTLVETRVKKGASIGAGAVICPGVVIGEGAMVGAGAVVTRDVAPGTLVFGNPAKEHEWPV
jgi:acetyltransferase-like isoleucine patch superfamily enzyme